MCLNDYAQIKCVVCSPHSIAKAVSINFFQCLHKILLIVIDICTLLNDIKVKFLIQILNTVVVRPGTQHFDICT